MGAWITITMSGGTSIERACEDAHRVANRLGISAEFDFNDVRCVATPQGSAELLATRQQAEQLRKSMGANDRKFASSDPRIKPAHEEPPVDPIQECLREAYGSAAPEFVSAFKKALAKRDMMILHTGPAVAQSKEPTL